jgi:hypothetical protein
LMLRTWFLYNIGEKIRSINVAFKHFRQKSGVALTYGRIVHLYLMDQCLHGYDYHLLKIRYAIFLAHLVKTEIKRIVL